MFLVASSTPLAWSSTSSCGCKARLSLYGAHWNDITWSKRGPFSANGWPGAVAMAWPLSPWPGTMPVIRGLPAAERVSAGLLLHQRKKSVREQARLPLLATSATWQGTRTKSALSPRADILALVRIKPVYGFTAKQDHVADLDFALLKRVDLGRRQLRRRLGAEGEG